MHQQQDPPPWDHRLPPRDPRTTKSHPRASGLAALATPLPTPRRRRRHHEPGRQQHWPAQSPLPRTQESRTRTLPRRHRDQHHPTRRPFHPPATRPHPHQPTDTPPSCDNELTTRVLCVPNNPSEQVKSHFAVAPRAARDNAPRPTRPCGSVGRGALSRVSVPRAGYWNSSQGPTPMAWARSSA